MKLVKRCLLIIIFKALGSGFKHLFESFLSFLAFIFSNFYFPWVFFFFCCSNFLRLAHFIHFHKCTEDSNLCSLSLTASHRFHASFVISFQVVTGPRSPSSTDATTVALESSPPHLGYLELQCTPARSTP